jgi:hypothetical protein
MDELKGWLKSYVENPKGKLAELLEPRKKTDADSKS